MNLTTIRTNIATVADGISTIRYAYPRGTDTVAGTPAVIVGEPRGEIIPGNRQVITLTIPIFLLVEALSDAPRDTKKIDDLINTFITTFAANQGLSGAVSWSYLTSFDTDYSVAIGEAQYYGVQFTMTASAHEAVTQTL